MKIKDERDELEKIINQSSDKIGQSAPTDSPELKMEPVFDADFNEIQKDCEKRAKKMIHTATGFMLSDEIIKQNPYLKNKMQIDVISLAGMLYQLTVNETMQKALMEEVRSGALHPRMFEVFAAVSKTIGELNKQLLQTTEAIKITYRDLRNDIREKNQDQMALTDGGITKNAKGILTSGTKELIKETKRLKIQSNSDIQDVEEITTNS